MMAPMCSNLSPRHEPCPAVVSRAILVFTFGITAQIEVSEWGAYIDQYAKGLPDDVAFARLGIKLG